MRADLLTGDQVKALTEDQSLTAIARAGDGSEKEFYAEYVASLKAIFYTIPAEYTLVGFRPRMRKEG